MAKNDKGGKTVNMETGREEKQKALEMALGNIEKSFGKGAS